MHGPRRPPRISEPIKDKLSHGQYIDHSHLKGFLILQTNFTHPKNGRCLVGPLPTKNAFHVLLAMRRASFFDRNDALESGPPIPTRTCLLSS